MHIFTPYYTPWQVEKKNPIEGRVINMHVLLHIFRGTAPICNYPGLIDRLFCCRLGCGRSRTYHMRGLALDHAPDYDGGDTKVH